MIWVLTIFLWSTSFWPANNKTNNENRFWSAWPGDETKIDEVNTRGEQAKRRPTTRLAGCNGARYYSVLCNGGDTTEYHPEKKKLRSRAPLTAVRGACAWAMTVRVVRPGVGMTVVTSHLHPRATHHATTFISRSLVSYTRTVSNVSLHPPPPLTT